MAIQLTDQTGFSVILPARASGIVSLVPSQTELLSALGLGNRVVGVTRFCVHPPEWRKEKAIIGGTKNPDISRIRDLEPDLIIANKEENEKQHVLALREEFPVYVSDVHDLGSACAMIDDIGELTGTQDVASQIRAEILSGFENLPKVSTGTVLYLIWKDPFLSVGGDTFIHDILSRSGLTNVTGERIRYPEVTEDDIRRMNPDFIFLSSEPYPFKEKHIAEFRQITPKATVMLVDGEMFSWYGSRLRHVPTYLQRLSLSKD